MYLVWSLYLPFHTAFIREHIMSTKSLIFAISFSLWMVAAPAAADSTARASEGSASVSAASGLIVAGSASVIAGSGQLVVAGVQTLGDAAIVTLRGASEAGTASLKVSREVAGAASLAVGTVVQVVAESSGYALTVAGRLIAFIPNEAGRSLLHHSRHEGAN